MSLLHWILFIWVGPPIIILMVMWAQEKFMAHMVCDKCKKKPPRLTIIEDKVTVRLCRSCAGVRG